MLSRDRLMKGVTPWAPLRPGDIVDLIAPGYPSTMSQVLEGAEFLKRWGLVPRIPKKMFARDLLCANSDEARLEQAKKALLAEDSAAIWCVRGGYGCIRLIPGLMKLKRPARSKLFIGLSDITTLHVFLNQEWRWPTVHGPLLDRLGRKAALPKYEKELRRFVFGEIEDMTFARLKPLNGAARKRGKSVSGLVTGGNLTVLQSSLGTPCSWQTKDRILFFEDIGERGYRIDRMLEQLAQGGHFDHAVAVIFGQFNEGNERDGRNLIPAVIRRFAESCPLPVLSGLQSGHDLIQRPLPFGTPSELKLGPDGGMLICRTGSR